MEIANIKEAEHYDRFMVQSFFYYVELLRLNCIMQNREEVKKEDDYLGKEKDKAGHNQFDPLYPF
ncbi:hypothetical protein QNH39_18555 [Neobacillus novalis]|uniref:Uncharacterized protein n=1 Tax=Neobacillus novalis TaxID=220687 RepID=A0AA95MMK3_9BACI|nr:hypothetical protein [Neobacillus novalis]WHY84640.1 hypothetical protein QNH39_18555 [Neobacillus novalis]